MTAPWWARPTAAVLFGGFGGMWPTRVHGTDAVPATGGVLFASNQLGFLDGPLLVGVAPRWVRCLVKSEMFHGVIGGVLRSAGQIPVHRDQVDRSALEAAGGRGRRPARGRRGRGVPRGDARAWRRVRRPARDRLAGVAGRGSGGAGGLPGHPSHGGEHARAPGAAPPAGRRLRWAGLAGAAARDVAPGRARRGGGDRAGVLAAHVREAVELTGQTLPADLGWSAEETRRGEHL